LTWRNWPLFLSLLILFLSGLLCMGLFAIGWRSYFLTHLFRSISRSQDIVSTIVNLGIFLLGSVDI